MYYIYKDKYNKEINNLDTKNRKKLDCKQLRLSDYQYSSEEEQEEKQKEDQEKKQEEETITDANVFNEQINKEEKNINNELFKKHFNFQNLSVMLKSLSNINDIEKNNKLVDVIISGLKDLKKEIKEMPEEERKIEKPDKILKIVREILQFNKEKQEGQGIKIPTPNQMLSRLPISLAQLEAGNNSEKLKNEIRQLLYSLYRSKNMTKQVYNNLIKHIWIKNIIIVHKIFIMIMIMIINITIIIIIIIIIIVIDIIKCIHYKKWRQFLWILKIVKRMNHTDLD